MQYLESVNPHVTWEYIPIIISFYREILLAVNGCIFWFLKLAAFSIFKWFVLTCKSLSICTERGYLEFS